MQKLSFEVPGASSHQARKVSIEFFLEPLVGEGGVVGGGTSVSLGRVF